MKKSVLVFLSLISCLSFTSCGSGTRSIDNLTISEDEFGHVVIHVKESQLDEYNFSLGDSLNFKFSNGYELDNVPFYDGYYGLKGDYMFVNYPGYEYPVLSREFETSIIDTGSLDINKHTVSISLYKKEVYKAEEESFSIKYSNDRKEYDSDESFANYRNIAIGNIKANRLYRSASPCNNEANRATYVSDLMYKDKIDYVFDLSNNLSKLKEYASIEETPSYWKTLFSKNQVFDCKVNANFFSEEYYPKIKILCDGIIDYDGKYLFHCFEGKDRTGFVAILLEALCGASIEEIETDYFVTYKNYYRLTKESDLSKFSIYESKKFYPMVNFICGKEVNENVTKLELFTGATNYLLKCGLSNERINLLIDKLTK